MNNIYTILDFFEIAFGEFDYDVLQIKKEKYCEILMSLRFVI